MQQTIKYSVIIPVYNAEAIIARTLEALLAQECGEPFEVITVDDGSTDYTAEILAKYPIKLLRKSNGGPASARNLGVKNASGEIILFLDSDCVPEPGWLQAMTAPFRQPEIAGVKGRYITRQKSLTARFVQLEFAERYRMLEKLPFIDFVDSYSAAFRKTAFFQVGGFDESFPKADNEDVDLSYKLANAGFKMVYRPEAVVEHTHPSTLKKYVKVKFGRGYWRMAVYKSHPHKAVKDSYTPQTLKMQIALSALWWLGLLWAIMGGNGHFVALVTILFLFSVLPFMVKAFNQDTIAAVLSPVMLFVRASCFCAGIGCGLFRHYIK